MTIRYCDFCGDVIPEDQGDPIALGDVLANPEYQKDACDGCTYLKALRSSALRSSLSDKPPLKSSHDSEIPERGDLNCRHCAGCGAIVLWRSDGRHTTSCPICGGSGKQPAGRHVIPGPRIIDQPAGGPPTSEGLSMTIRYCDFCGEVIPEDTGDPIALGDASNREYVKDACDACYSILWRFTNYRNLKSVAEGLGSPVSPAPDSALRGDWRVGSKVALNIYEGDRPVCQCHTALDAQRIVSAINRQRQQAGGPPTSDLEASPDSTPNDSGVPS